MAVPELCPTTLRTLERDTPDDLPIRRCEPIELGDPFAVLACDPDGVVGHRQEVTDDVELLGRGGLEVGHRRAVGRSWAHPGQSRTLERLW
jgi:hypothetical protein